MDLIDYFSCVALPIRLYQDENFLGPATSFCYEYAGKKYLISNWHVFSGRNPDTGQALSATSMIPNKFSIQLHGNEVGSYSGEITCDLYDKSGSALWLQHLQGQNVDIAAIHVSELGDRFKFYSANDPNHCNGKLSIRITDEVFITGFPRGLAKQGIFPVWKRGTIAAEPNISIGETDTTYLVDTATREGMSGSPVFRRSNNGVASYTDGSVGMHQGEVTRFVGVYSGRFGADDELSAQLGRVWKEEKVQELLWAPELGSYQIRKRN
jgi:hypothetical protein